MPEASLDRGEDRDEDEAATAPPPEPLLAPPQPLLALPEPLLPPPETSLALPVAAEVAALPAGSSEREEPLSREALLALVACALCGVSLFVAGNFALLAMAVTLAVVFLEIITVRYVLRRPSSGSRAPYPTDGSDRRGAVTFLYAALLKRYAVLVLASIAVMAVPLVTRAMYLIPLMGVGLLGVSLATLFWFDQLRWVRQCARVLNVYDFEFRTPVYGLELWRSGQRILVLGYEGLKSPDMYAREPMGHHRWPERIAEGAWFAGDEVFGGVLLVPWTGELMCMQPLDWDELKPWREDASAERRAKAKRAGLDRQSV